MTYLISYSTFLLNKYGFIEHQNFNVSLNHLSLEDLK